MSKFAQWLVPDWPAPLGVRALVTTRKGGFSRPPFDELNLATHVGDQPEAVKLNRELLKQSAHLPAEPVWLNQVHGTNIWVGQESLADFNVPTADGAVTRYVDQVLAIMTADCLPVLFADAKARVVGAAHAGWRGLSQGVLERTITSMHEQVQGESFADFLDSLMVWLGPSIGQRQFQVGSEVRDVFYEEAYKSNGVKALAMIEICFRPDQMHPGKYFADLHGLARWRLQAFGIRQIYGNPHCCYEDHEHFYSYRREKITGRFATLIWRESMP